MEFYEKIEHALSQCGCPPLRGPQYIRYLGEGAWHSAYLLSLSDGRELVIRFPKPVSYGKPFLYDEKSLHSDYAGVGYFYRQANRVSPGICPEEYHYRVHPELTFTLETYLGATTSVADWNQETALDYGRQIGSFMRRLHELPVELEGHGTLEWKGSRLQGAVLSDVYEDLREETEDTLRNLEGLLNAPVAFNRLEVQRKTRDVLASRPVLREPMALTNRDVSPENLIVHEGRIRLIDPVPIIHNGTIFAGNFVNLYHTYFAALHNSPRYARHRFDLYRDALKTMGDGFLDGYAAGSEEVRHAVLGEAYLHLLSVAHGHYELLKQAITVEKCIRLGERAHIEERLEVLLRELEQAPL